MKKWLACCLLLLIFLLSGCSFTDTANDQLALVADAVNADDPEAFVALFYPDAIPQETLLAFFEEIRSYGQTMDISEARMISFNYKSTSSGGHRQVSQSGTYLLSIEQALYQLSLHHIESDGTTGLVEMGINKLADSTPLPISLIWGLTIVLPIAAFVFLIVTIVDICRKRPRRTVLWILLCLFLAIRFSILGIRFLLPLGVILYWCFRRKLLRRKTETTSEETTSEETPASPTPDT